ncbi:hypothetical protein PaeBR_09945 [Paenibacillus sp. BR2-3]|uniref:hypothetical protein n=1 Tax=Paenibacillus sp. BR2-3 TaxID=3048494 RepID=UPI0039772BE8
MITSTLCVLIGDNNKDAAPDHTITLLESGGADVWKENNLYAARYLFRRCRAGIFFCSIHVLTPVIADSAFRADHKLLFKGEITPLKMILKNLKTAEYSAVFSLFLID